MARFVPLVYTMFVLLPFVLSAENGPTVEGGGPTCRYYQQAACFGHTNCKDVCRRKPYLGGTCHGIPVFFTWCCCDGPCGLRPDRYRTLCKRWILKSKLSSFVSSTFTCKKGF